MTDLVLVPLSGVAEARQLTEQIKVAVEATWQLVARAYQCRAWALMGYSSWDDYCRGEFGTSRIRLPREERTEVVASLRDSGLSIRAITAVTGDSRNTVHRAIASEASVPNGTLAAPASAPTTTTEQEDAVPAPTANDDPPTITGINGKNYRARKHREAPSLAFPQPPKMGGNRRKHLQQIEALVASLSGALIAFDGVDALDDTVTAEEAGVLTADLSKQIQALSRINKLLKERTTP